MANTSTATSENMPALPPMMPDAVPGDPISANDLTEAGVGAGPVGSAGEGPSSGPASNAEPEPTPTPTPTPTPSSSGSGDPGGDAADETTGTAAFASIAGDTLIDLLKNATSPEALEAQNIILRRIALQGDVIPSRVPPPRNITEIGGYLNLLTNLNELDMRSQVLAGILGVAGPNPPLSDAGIATFLSFTPVINDRPTGPFQASLPVTVLIRSDFAGLIKAAMARLHERGATLAMLAGPYALPPAESPLTTIIDPLDYVGRTLRLAGALALTDPGTDPLALVRQSGSSAPYKLAARSDGTGSIEVAATDYEALQTGPTGIASVTVTAGRFVILEELLSDTGFEPGGPAITDPEKAIPTEWAKWRNLAGLEPGVTLGEELRLLHSQTEILGSALAAKVNWRWNGTEFAP
ncbi:hypothetical protein [Novosphingobium sp. PP1Y]|uniref:hypothetical protein n=1 Tax=Novosphingobium sp. PP1Y TaxID=702113 RepID=UPI00020EE5ED|nr:hypothetical protein [Novosphingobium sp. PP1Y]CCA89894.1 hypothetical protein PP1Y_Lpl961 [Novosphingobium sp. PP1Y]